MNRFEIFQVIFIYNCSLFIFINLLINIIYYIFYIVNVLIKIFLSSQILIPNILFPLKPMDYIYEVLVPEVTIRLIQNNYNGNITLDNTREIMINSIDFGTQ